MLFRSADALRAAMRAAGLDAPDTAPWGKLVDGILTQSLEPTLVQPTILLDYPLELSPFAKKREDDPRFVERFEAFCGGMEIANGFSELNDPDDQRARFEEQAAAGRAGDEEAHPVDEDYVTALEYGLPPTGGVGLGIDRLCMMLLGQESIRDVIAFPKTQRAQDLLTQAPSPVDEKQLRELHIRLRAAEAKVAAPNAATTA